jgi:hypothetical protein
MARLTDVPATLFSLAQATNMDKLKADHTATGTYGRASFDGESRDWIRRVFPCSVDLEMA